VDIPKTLSASNTMATLIEVAEHIDKLVSISFDECDRQIDEAVVIGEQLQRFHNQQAAYRRGLRAAYKVVMQRYHQRAKELERVDYYDSPIGDRLRFVPNPKSTKD
jgi:hypothetical protein